MKYLLLQTDPLAGLQWWLLFIKCCKAYLNLWFFFPQVVSEEKDKKPLDFSSIPPIDLHLPEVENLVTNDQSVPKYQITVWIDPLDATQEYKDMKEKGRVLV